MEHLSRLRTAGIQPGEEPHSDALARLRHAPNATPGRSRRNKDQYARLARPMQRLLGRVGRRGEWPIDKTPRLSYRYRKGVRLVCPYW